ncbi:creatininase family protein [uncultured Parasphingorhabdus sp.]|uniref:creatininase family protein n=1 Tax=uncultured Parasphingorhabdus sp. TaxID=2709694 RepID=UPI002AA6637F|nr:creatininase family protein [uncultured Parasphingorhabdus sp.]
MKKNLMLLACAAALTSLPVQAQTATASASWITLPEANPIATPDRVKVKNFLPEMTWKEVEDLLTRTDMVIVPIGAIEQHGPQGPLGTDYLNGTEVAKLAAQYTDVLVAPILNVGQSPYHLAFPGTVSLSSETIQAVYVEAIKSLIGQGFKRFLILNSHGGNRATTKFIVDRINQETPGIAVDLGEASQPYMKPNKSKAPKPFDRHGGVRETSRTMYLHPELVDLAASKQTKLHMPDHLTALIPDIEAGDPTANLIFLVEALKAKSTGKGTAADEMTDTGVWSELDPATATAEAGRLDIEVTLNAIVQFIDRWKELRPIGSK